MSTKSSYPTTEHTAALIREWVATVDRAVSPKPMALAYVAAGDPVALARITLRTIREGILEDSMGLARLALIVGATAESEAPGDRPSTGWGTEAHVRVGLALIDCVLRATEWLALAATPYDGSRAALGLGTRLALAVKPGAMDAAHHRLGLEVPRPESYRPTIQDLAPPYRTIPTLMGGQRVTLVLAETAEDLPGGNPAHAHWTPPQRV